MNGNYKNLGLVLLLTLLSSTLLACGNKGELYLQPIDLTEEQRELLNELEGNKPKVKKNKSELNTPSNGSEVIESVAPSKATQ